MKTELIWFLVLFGWGAIVARALSPRGALGALVRRRCAHPRATDAEYVIARLEAQDGHRAFVAEQSVCPDCRLITLRYMCDSEFIPLEHPGALTMARTVDPEPEGPIIIRGNVATRGGRVIPFPADERHRFRNLPIS